MNTIVQPYEQFDKSVVEHCRATRKLRHTREETVPLKTRPTPLPKDAHWEARRLLEWTDYTEQMRHEY